MTIAQHRQASGRDQRVAAEGRAVVAGLEDIGMLFGQDGADRHAACSPLAIVKTSGSTP